MHGAYNETCRPGRVGAQTGSEMDTVMSESPWEGKYVAPSLPVPEEVKGQPDDALIRSANY